jgi:hypothetical protein
MSQVTFPPSLRALLLAALLGPAAPAPARVLSYAPVSARPAVPAIQSRLDRRNVLVERVGNDFGPWAGPICWPCVTTSRLVVYDAEGIDEPRDVSPGGEPSRIFLAASFEEGGTVRILAVTDATLPGEAGPSPTRLLYSRDTGETWAPVTLPQSLDPERLVTAGLPDTGGWVARERGAALRLGTSAFPFVLALPNTAASAGTFSLVAVEVSGQTRLLASGQGPVSGSPLVGADVYWARFLLAADLVRPGPGGAGEGDLKSRGLFLVDLSGNVTRLLDLGALPATLQAWTAVDGSTFVGVDETAGAAAAPFSAPRSFGVVRDAVYTELATADGGTQARLFGVPSATGKGAWFVKRDAGATELMSFSAEKGFRTYWSDTTRPKVEALHVGLSGNRLLLQVHRPRPEPARRFLDPALAVWEVGQPAPARFDELYLDESATRGFVHLDVDAVSNGAPFLFDAGISPPTVLPPAGGPAGGGGGGDVVQEWGVVRGSLAQRLLVPAAARADGRNGSTWRTDLTLRNPGDTPLPVFVGLVPNPETAPGAAGTQIVLEPGEIRFVPDVLDALFGLDAGSGALLVVPPLGASVEATSRTYSLAGSGTFGMGVAAVDVFASSSANFPVTFAAALLGSGFRTNVVATDASVRGSRLALSVAPASADLSPVTLDLDAPTGTQRQLNGLAAAAGLPGESRGSLDLAPQKGAVVAGITVIDDATNDPTWFGPDLPATEARTIPALVHADGGNGAAYRSDLYFFNPTSEARFVTLTARDWASPQTTKSLFLTLLPQESKVIRDALPGAFGLTGVAQVTFTSDASSETAEGVRVTSRTYTAAPGGGTYGHPVPPLNAFQSVASGESLEILGPMQAPGFRTNLALVDLAAPGATGAPLNVRVEIVDRQGVVADAFTQPLAPGAGVQINDLFAARGLPPSLGPVLIRVSPSGGNVAAYATTIDAATNDPTYYPAQLAAREE